MATDVQKVRALIPDTEAAFDGETMFSNEDIETYLEVAGGSVLRAAAYAVYAIATSEALISKIIRTQDLSTNGAGVAEALHKKAEALAKRADAEEASGDVYYNIVDFGWDERPELTEWNWGYYDGRG